MMDTYSKIMFYCANKTQTDFFFSQQFFDILKRQSFFKRKRRNIVILQYTADNIYV